jgi:deazaflavin-dependent oxidoreductase (nitroreductase family)
MPMPRVMARMNRAGINRLLRRIAPRMPGLGVVVHRGRRSGRTYRTPVAVFATSTGPVIGLFYGLQSDWVKNVLAAGEVEMLARGRTVHFGSPRIYHDESRAGFGVVPRQILRLFLVNDFLALDSTSPGAEPPD